MQGSISTPCLTGDAAEGTKVLEATKKTLERGKILFNVRVTVSNLNFLKVISNLENILWVGVEFCFENGEIAQYIQRMLPKHLIAAEIGSTTVEISRPLETTADSPL